MTATTKHGKVNAALMAHAELMETTGPTLPVSFPEQPQSFVPPEDGKYIEVLLFGNGPMWEGINGHMFMGILGVLVHWPKNSGIVAAIDKAGLVVQHFAKNLQLFSGGQKVTIYREPQILSLLSESDKLMVPVNIFWQA